MDSISDKVKKIRVEYEDKPLNVEDLDTNPLEQFNIWFQIAIDAEVNEANAMAISTISKEGTPRSRYVLFKDIVEDQLVFYSDYESSKGQEMEQNPNISGLFFWPELHRQIRLEGIVSKTSDEVSDSYFASRPRGAQLSAIASSQSSEIEGRETVEDRIKELEKEFDGKDIPRPDNWGGYAIDISFWEFWQGRRSRTHDRFIYIKNDNSWEITRLSP
tara:strand:- start:182 stop:832 length:651 start_codon:yes stop_codon:yes gene_type:complete